MDRRAARLTGRVSMKKRLPPDGFVVADAAVDGPRRLLVDDAGPRLFLTLLLFLGLQAGLEGIDAFTEVAHDPRQLPAAAEHQHDDCQEDQKMPNAQTTHGVILSKAVFRTIPQRQARRNPAALSQTAAAVAKRGCVRWAVCGPAGLGKQQDYSAAALMRCPGH